MRPIISIGLALTALACSHSGNELSRFHEDGRAKPAVAIASVIDTTSLDIPWSLSEELTSAIVRRIASDGSIYTIAKEDLAYTENPFSNDLSWVKREFSDNEFVVFLELVEHEEAPASKGKKKADIEVPFETSTNLKMAMRLRVLDLRGLTPRIVLQEIVRDAYYIPKNMIPTDYNVAVWGTDEYTQSPMNLAHLQLVQEISTRVSEYIHLAKSR